MTFSWYSVTISSLEHGKTIYNGYFKVDNDCNLVIGFYETKDGITDFQDNKLIPANSHYTDTSNPSEFNDNIYIEPSDYFTNGGICFNANLNVYNKITNSITLHYSINDPEDPPDQIEFNYNNNNNISSNDYFYNIVPISDPSCFNKEAKIQCINKNLRQRHFVISYKYKYKKKWTMEKW